MREISAAGLISLFAETTDSAWIAALTLTDPAGVQPTLRACANTVDLSYGGHTYTACPFEWIMADDTETSVAQARIRVDNVSQEITLAIRQIIESPLIDLELFRVGPDGVVHREMGPSRFELLSCTADALVVEGTLGYEHDFLNESAQQYSFTPTLCPGLFA
jgi:hypothetical protein